MDNYEDIIDLPHHVSKTHPQMPMQSRAAQFAPFAALTGHGAAIRETARLTESMERDSIQTEMLDRKIALLMDRLQDTPEVEITHFVPDGKKAGGRYVTVSGTVKAIDEAERQLIMADGQAIPLWSITEIDGSIFDD